MHRGSVARPADDAHWRAVVDRRPPEGSVFVYAVVTTGIYCRPGCPSRRPKRENVRIFEGPAAARAAGFRPCQRCRPDEAPGADLAARIARARTRLEDTAEAEPALADLAAAAGFSPSHFHRVFKAQVGLSPKAYARTVRAARLRAALEEGASVTDATYEAGYSGPARAHADADAALGMTPSAYRRGGAGVQIDHVIVDSALGRLLVAATPRGLCAVAMGEDDAALLAALRARFPNATLRADGAAAHAVLPAVLALAAAPGTAPEVPLDLAGTAFQRRVWAELRRIPAGETRTYSAVAAAIGQPTATRAVARACADNPVALVVPCHRVVRTDGGLGGYRWGPARKRALLDTEAASNPSDTKSDS
ncbi:bifunctional DNA-binding transcriptional regulator/O6-methylguanine-DNA methyltransferase Ada [Roseospira goensis]|uniref:methylated-DNA--[protein]-cysteine S-methyltransferase n=1 Tax=Roseospira goensis TaxID=391922 RepID=A0A7W6RY00_9PROT|nr:bifunctional DNA-binding transcriptional regulator/O6-methylguanine-DNA methyltransferase Ada [Roseospira goensis]MBB4285293.1 AraC family transcriptional regulator of adaptative response/methylated-DNA-[protein]-cysteine methyltransferase [Roseospira goensis]